MSVLTSVYDALRLSGMCCDPYLLELITEDLQSFKTVKAPLSQGSRFLYLSHNKLYRV